jgi:hypothetical protein
MRQAKGMDVDISEVHSITLNCASVGQTDASSRICFAAAVGLTDAS